MSDLIKSGAACLVDLCGEGLLGVVLKAGLASVLLDFVSGEDQDRADVDNRATWNASGGEYTSTF